MHLVYAICVFSKCVLVNHIHAACNVCVAAGYIICLGDRHSHNSLQDYKTDEVVHVDLVFLASQQRALPEYNRAGALPVALLTAWAPQIPPTDLLPCPALHCQTLPCPVCPVL